MSPRKPPAQAAAASAALAQRPSATASSGSEQQAEPQQRARNPQRQQGSCKVQKPRRHTNEHISKSWDCITSAGAPRGTFGITSTARETLGITAARAFPHAGRWESLATRAGTACWNLGRLPEPHSVLNSAAEYPRAHYRTDSVHTSVSRITVTCRVRNNRIICQSSDPLEGMAITLNQWILLTARAARPDAVAPNARRGTRLPPPQVSRIAR